MPLIKIYQWTTWSDEVLITPYSKVKKEPIFEKEFFHIRESQTTLTKDEIKRFLEGSAEKTIFCVARSFLSRWTKEQTNRQTNAVKRSRKKEKLNRKEKGCSKLLKIN